MYAPFVSPKAGTFCDDADLSYAGATSVVNDSATGFWAGWHCTSIPSGDASVVYTDVSVLYLRTLGCYVMFAVECDGRGMGTTMDATGAYLDVEATGGCNLCTPSDGTSACLRGDVPKTRFVFFTCADADFDEGNTQGPFPLAPAAPDHTLGQWIGVPQAFLSPDEEYLLYYHGVGEVASYPFAGLHIARLDDLVAVVALFRSDFDAADGGLAMASRGSEIYQHFVNMGDISIDCDTPSSGNAPVVTDPHFVFCDDGRLHLYFANRWDPILPLGLISHAAALEVWDSPTIATLFVPSFGPAVSPADILVNFRMAACDPVRVNRVLGNHDGTEVSVLDENGNPIVVMFNDPTVYKVDSGEYVMIVHCAALGGSIRLTADADVACVARGSC